MHKLMIVDDEQIVRDGIKFIIDKAFPETIEVVAMARTGREAIEKFETHRPSIVLMDIQMPGINGIEAIRALKEMDKKIKCVIISAYEQFDYAKQAVELGVIDYLLKPINRKNLEKIIEKIIREIDTEKTLKLKEIENQEKFDKIIPVLENGFIYSILMNNDYSGEIDKYRMLFNIEKDYAYTMVIDLGEDKESTEVINKIGSSVKNNIQYDAMRNAIKYKCRCVVGPLIINRITVLIFAKEEGSGYDQRLKAIELGESIYQSLDRIVDSNIYIGIGSTYKIANANGSYLEAVRAIGKMRDEHVLHIQDASGSSEDQNALVLQKTKADEGVLMKHLDDGEYEQVAQCIVRIFSRLQKQYGTMGNVVRNVSMEMLVLMHTTAYRQGIHDGLETDSYLDEVKELDSISKLESYCLLKAKIITDNMRKIKESNLSQVIQNAKDYIDAHYMEELGLKDVSEAVSISPQYFSKIFKADLGVNFIDYLTKVRMEKAKELLKTNNLSVKEISFEIGYNDPNYFSRLFKKVVGVSPTEYK